MAVYQFAYVDVRLPPTPAFPTGRLARRPILSLAIQNGQRRFACYAIVDSGADHCVFPRSFMQPLGLDPLTAPTDVTSGVGSADVPLHFANVTLHFGFTQFGIYAGFTTGVDRLGIGLLGQTGFFDRHRVTFDYRNNAFDVEPMEIPS